jgi:hypothetical protein
MVELVGVVSQNGNTARSSGVSWSMPLVNVNVSGALAGGWR